MISQLPQAEAPRDLTKKRKRSSRSVNSTKEQVKKAKLANAAVDDTEPNQNLPEAEVGPEGPGASKSFKALWETIVSHPGYHSILSRPSSACVAPGTSLTIAEVHERIQTLVDCVLAFSVNQANVDCLLAYAKGCEKTENATGTDRFLYVLYRIQFASKILA